jgi:hypothetical protein
MSDVRKIAFVFGRILSGIRTQPRASLLLPQPVLIKGTVVGASGADLRGAGMEFGSAGREDV